MTTDNEFPNPQISLDFGDIVRSYGYPFEEHTVTTSDGYILRLFRISHGLNDTYYPRRPVLLLQPGLFELPDTFIIRGTLLSPGFYIVNNGYDVWFS